MFKHYNQFSASKAWSFTSLLTIVLPVLLLLAFLAQQLASLDSSGWSHGFSHPLEGWDHLVTMLAVGIWAAQMRGKAIWILPLVFVSVMSLGGIAGAAGLSIPSVEGIILLSCAVFSVLITRKIRFSTQINVLIVGFFAFFHGFAHGQEISASASLVSYTLGFMLATLLLHGAGILVAKLIVLSIVSMMTLLTANISQASNADSRLGFQDYKQTSTFTDVFKLFHSEQRTQQCQQTFASPPLAAIPQATGNYQAFSITEQYYTVSPNLEQSFALNAKLDRLVVLAAYSAQKRVFLMDINRIMCRFNAYFPDINNSPGTCLHSSGVGLTSPPELFVTPDFSRLTSSFSPQYFLIDAPVAQLTPLYFARPHLTSTLHAFDAQFVRAAELLMHAHFAAYNLNSECTKPLCLIDSEPMSYALLATNSLAVALSLKVSAYADIFQNHLLTDPPLLAVVKPPPISYLNLLA